MLNTAAWLHVKDCMCRYDPAYPGPEGPGLRPLHFDQRVLRHLEPLVVPRDREAHNKKIETTFLRKLRHLNPEALGPDDELAPLIRQTLDELDEYDDLVDAVEVLGLPFTPSPHPPPPLDSETYTTLPHAVHEFYTRYGAIHLGELELYNDPIEEWHSPDLATNFPELGIIDDGVWLGIGSVGSFMEDHDVWLLLNPRSEAVMVYSAWFWREDGCQEEPNHHGVRAQYSGFYEFLDRYLLGPEYMGRYSTLGQWNAEEECDDAWSALLISLGVSHPAAQ